MSSLICHYLLLFQTHAAHSERHAFKASKTSEDLNENSRKICHALLRFDVPELKIFVGW